MQTYRGMITVHKSKKMILIIGIILLSAIVIANLEFTKHLAIMPPATKLPWYDIQDWELDVCSKYGGRTQSIQTTTPDPSISYGDISITIQARKTKTLNETLYQISYFLESYTATTNYILRLTNQKTGATKEITRGDLEPGNGATDYWTQYLPEDYTTLTFNYYKGEIQIPIVEVR